MAGRRPATAEGVSPRHSLTRSPAAIAYRPHSAILADYTPLTVALALAGYAVVCPNYRGSLGYGNDSIASLLGNIGQQARTGCGRLAICA